MYSVLTKYLHLMYLFVKSQLQVSTYFTEILYNRMEYNVDQILTFWLHMIALFQLRPKLSSFFVSAAEKHLHCMMLVYRQWCTWFVSCHTQALFSFQLISIWPSSTCFLCPLYSHAIFKPSYNILDPNPDLNR